jgi:hypothetical protein
VSLHARNHPKTVAAGSKQESKAKPKVRGFGHSPDQEAQHFIVVVPKAQAADVMIYEVYQEDAAGPQLDAANLRCILNRTKWLKIVDALEEEHNKRLRAAGMKAASFKAGETPVARLLGKELVLLAWAIEDADASLAPAAIENWRGLSPEERWWLYTMTAAQTGHHGKRNTGWRKAVRYALTENPVVATPAVTTAEHKRRTNVATKEEGQGKLFGFEEPSFAIAGGNGIWGDSPAPRAPLILPQAPSARGEGRGERQPYTLTSAQTPAPHPSPLPASGERGRIEPASRPATQGKRGKKKRATEQDEQGKLPGFDAPPPATTAANGIRGEPCEQLPERKKPTPQPRAAQSTGKAGKASLSSSSRSRSSPRNATRSERRTQARR